MVSVGRAVRTSAHVVKSSSLKQSRVPVSLRQMSGGRSLEWWFVYGGGKTTKEKAEPFDPFQLSCLVPLTILY